MIHVGLKCMCVNISFLYTILACQGRYPRALSNARSPKGELSGAFCFLHPGFLRWELNSSAARGLLYLLWGKEVWRVGGKEKSTRSFPLEMEDLVYLLLISGMICSPPPQLIRSGYTLDTYHCHPQVLSSSDTGAPA